MANDPANQDGPSNAPLCPHPRLHPRPHPRPRPRSYSKDCFCHYRHHCHGRCCCCRRFVFRAASPSTWSKTSCKSCCALSSAWTLATTRSNTRLQTGRLQYSHHHHHRSAARPVEDSLQFIGMLAMQTQKRVVSMIAKKPPSPKRTLVLEQRLLLGTPTGVARYSAS